MLDEITLKEGVVFTMASDEKQNRTLHEAPPGCGRNQIKRSRLACQLDIGERVVVLDVVEISNKSVCAYHGRFWIKVRSLSDPSREGWMTFKIPDSAVPTGYRIRPVHTLTIMIEKIT
jgi:hypothetical protein